MRMWNFDNRVGARKARCRTLQNDADWVTIAQVLSSGTVKIFTTQEWGLEFCARNRIHCKIYCRTHRKLHCRTHSRTQLQNPLQNLFQNLLLASVRTNFGRLSDPPIHLDRS